MDSPKNADCRMEITFSTTPDGRPEIYDFLWEHLPALYEELKEKEVLLRMPTTPAPAKKKNVAHAIIHHFDQKFQRDSRATIQTKETVLQARVPIAQLDSLLNAYNILLDAHLPALSFSAEKLSVDFSRATKQTILIHTQKKNAEKIRTFLKKNCATPPLIHQISFPSPASLHALTRGEN